VITQLSGLLGTLLTVLFHWFGSYGLAIILLTLLLRLVLVPLTIPQLRMTRKMAEIAPAMKKLQEKFKQDPQRQQKEILALWKKNNVNPAAGCLPLLLQMPFLWALFYTFRDYHYIAASAGFLWIPSLSHPDPSYVMAVLVAVTTYLSMRFASPTTTTDSSQRITFLILPVVFGYFSANYAAGLSLYWVVSNLFTYAQQVVLLKHLPGLKGGVTHS
jgi:YidC/Oxa1 family membrane protein insertase